MSANTLPVADAWALGGKHGQIRSETASRQGPGGRHGAKARSYSLLPNWTFNSVTHQSQNCLNQPAMVWRQVTQARAKQSR